MSSFPFLWVLMPSMLQQHPFSHSRGIPSVFAFLWKTVCWKKGLMASFSWWYELNFWKSSLQQGFCILANDFFISPRQGTSHGTLEGIVLMILKIVTSKAQTTSCDYLPKDTCLIPIAFLKISPHIRIKLIYQNTLGDGYSTVKGYKLPVTKIIMWMVPTAIFPLLALKEFVFLCNRL